MCHHNHCFIYKKFHHSIFLAGTPFESKIFITSAISESITLDIDVEHSKYLLYSMELEKKPANQFLISLLFFSISLKIIFSQFRNKSTVLIL
jgi:hypothetical protein